MEHSNPKRPSFQFYPADWLRSTALRSCSLEARGLWMDMMCYMHEGSPYGYLKVNHKVISPEILSKIIGVKLRKILQLLSELRDAGVFQEIDGIIYSPRMARDEEIRIKRSAGGCKGGNPNLIQKKKVNLPSNLDPTIQPSFDGTFRVTPSSSSSYSSSKNTPIIPNGDEVVEGEIPESKVPNPFMIRLGKLFHRRPTTPWQEKEIRAFKKLKITEDELRIIEGRYSRNEPYARKDLYTLLNNWRGEIDREQNKTPSRPIYAQKNGTPQVSLNPNFMPELRL